ncbi:MAG: Hint domain-containing protein, partial [Nitrospira sp.]|nr:Hint domain-containing protein [Nitrospira sp.]
MPIQILRHAALTPERVARRTQSGDPSFKLESDTLSMDKTDKPYKMLRDLLGANAVNYYRYPIFEEEVLALEHDPTSKAGKGSVDHPKGGCFVGSTRIPLLDGTIPTIEELDGKEVWVYSTDDEGKVVPGLARGRRTKWTPSLVDVILDSGAVVRCTPDHLFRLRDGSYKTAASLVPAVDRLMPINRTWSTDGGYVTDLRGQQSGDGDKHKVRMVVPVDLEIPVPVYDLEVDKWSNFALSVGVFVHNSKDVADAVAGACYGVATSKLGLPVDPVKESIGD